MKLQDKIAAGRERWSVLSFYGKFEHTIILILTGLIRLETTGRFR